jgi:hypothetical protein
MFRKDPVRRVEGGFRMDVDAAHRRVLGDLLGQLRDSMVDSTDDERFRRLFPVAYHQDPDHDVEYQRLMHGELLASRLDAVNGAVTILERDAADDHLVLNDDELDVVMRSLNDLRLVIGTVLDVQEDHDDPPGPDDPAFAHFQLYGYLGWLLEWVVQAQQDSPDDQ